MGLTSSSSSASSSSSSKLGFGSSFHEAVDAEDADEDILDLRQQFHNTVRENIIFLLFFLTLCMISWTVIGAFIRRKDKDEVDTSTRPPPSDDDESVVYRICFWLCVFSLSISMGAALLLPISIVSNEVLLLYPNTYYVQWLNGMLIQGLWNLIFLFANISLFILLPFAHLFMESEGFSGHKKGLTGKFYETCVILGLSGFAILGISHILAAVLSPGRSILGGWFNLIGFSNQLPFIYSCISFVGVVLLLMCTPLGFAHLFTVLSQLMVGPQFLRNLEEEYGEKFLELESLKNKLKRKTENINKMKHCLEFYYKKCKSEKSAKEKEKERLEGEERKRAEQEPFDLNKMKLKWDKIFKEVEETDTELELVVNRDPEFVMQYQRMMSIVPNADKVLEQESEESIKNRIEIMTLELNELEKLKKTPGWKRNLLYPLAFLIVLVLTALTVFMVIINTLQLLVGLKALPLSAQSFSLGLSSMSILGAWGAGLEVILIMYLMTTSIIGLYNLPGVRNIKPRPGDSPTSHIIYNCGLVLILSSALPLLARILGITNFDLLGNYGQIEWLGNFYIVFLYNIIFSGASSICLINKFTTTIREELCSRLRSFFRFRVLQTLWRSLSGRNNVIPLGLSASSSPYSSRFNWSNGDNSSSPSTPLRTSVDENGKPSNRANRRNNIAATDSGYIDMLPQSNSKED